MEFYVKDLKTNKWLESYDNMHITQEWTDDIERAASFPEKEWAENCLLNCPRGFYQIVEVY